MQAARRVDRRFTAGESEILEPFVIWALELETTPSRIWEAM